jgi:pullulanase/glycogen debranching enzyme
MVNVAGAEWLDEKRGWLFLERNLREGESLTFSGALLVDDSPQNFSLSPAPLLDFAETSGCFLENVNIVFVLSKNTIPLHALSGENFYVAGDFNGWLSDGLYEKWQLKCETIQGKSYFILKIPQNELPESCQFKFVTGNWEWLPLPSYCRNNITPRPGIENLEYHAKKTGQHVLQFLLTNGSFDLRKTASIIYGCEKIKIDDSRLLFSLSTDEKLGAWIEADKTFFALFAPRALAVEVCWKKILTENFTCLSMKRSPNGVWHAEVEGNLNRQYYQFRVKNKTNNRETFTEVLDPYAKVAVNCRGPGIVVEEKNVKHHFEAPPRENLIIYEGHVRDLTANFLGIAAEEKLWFKGFEKFIKSGYLQDLGVNAIQLQPIQEFDNPSREDYHWGYMPVNYFSPASVYSSDPSKGAQIDEFRSLVQTCHDYGLTVILDVVYNHVGEPNHLYAVDPRYYFRMNDDGILLNFSGCGNDLRTESPMVQKMIADSLEYFVKFYDIDGFRFDLAELVGLPLLEKIQAQLQKIKPSIVMIAEPWSFRGYVGHDIRRTNLQGWNDEFRDFVKSYVLGNGNVEGMGYFLRGSLAFRSQFPAQSVNYLASHDDFCWIDAIAENVNHSGILPALTDIRRTHLALAILFLSLGVPMLGAGTELLHSKDGMANTYRRGDLNALAYDRRMEYFFTYKYGQQLIKLRKNLPLFCLQECLSEEYIHIFAAQENNSALSALFNATWERGAEQVLLAINPHFEKVHFVIPFGNNFTQIADTFSFSDENRATYPWQGDILELPPLSCGIWRNEVTKN